MKKNRRKVINISQNISDGHESTNNIEEENNENEEETASDNENALLSMQADSQSMPKTSSQVDNQNQAIETHVLSHDCSATNIQQSTTAISTPVPASLIPLMPPSEQQQQDQRQVKMETLPIDETRRIGDEEERMPIDSNTSMVIQQTSSAPTLTSNDDDDIEIVEVKPPVSKVPNSANIRIKEEREINVRSNVSGRSLSGSTMASFNSNMAHLVPEKVLSDFMVDDQLYFVMKWKNCTENSSSKLFILF